MGVASDQQFMAQALELAQQAADAGEVPVGCVVVQQGQVIGAAHNAPISSNDPCGHAEIRALRLAGAGARNYRLPDCELFVTLEPCAMCAGAMVHARISRLIYGAADPRAGGAGSVLDITGPEYGNHHVQVTPGVLDQPCGRLLRDFFKARR